MEIQDSLDGKVTRSPKRSHSEERLAAYLRATTNAVYVMSPDWSEMLQLSGSGFLADTPRPNRSWLEPYIPEEARPRVLQAIQHAIQTGSMFQLEHPVRREDGTIAWTLSRAVPLKNEEGEITEWIGAASDMTSLRQNDELRNALAERDALLKEVHHRVKNNLQVITSLLEMQARQSGDAQTAASFEEACNRVGSIAVIHEMLYQSGMFSTVDLFEYAQRLVPYLITFYDPRQRIRSSVEGDRVAVELDKAVPFGLLLNELVSNTCKHAFPKDASGTLIVHLAMQGNGFRLTVEDTGVGMPQDFERTEYSQTLGLRLVRTLVEQLRGSVHFHPGSSCRVDIDVPLRAPAGDVPHT